MMGALRLEDLFSEEEIKLCQGKHINTEQRVHILTMADLKDIGHAISTKELTDMDAAKLAFSSIFHLAGEHPKEAYIFNS